jgi:hypothetical protein
MSENPTSGGERTVALAMFAAIAGLGVFLLVFAVKDFARARASFDWVPIEGVVLSKDEANSARIRYAYVAGGHGHEATRVRFLSGLANEAKTSHLRPGEGVAVYVDPNNPEISVLRPGGSGLLFLGAATAAGALVFIGLGGIIRSLIIVGRDPAAIIAAAAGGEWRASNIAKSGIAE